MTDFDKTLHAQLRHLIDDLTVAVDDDGHTRYAPKNTLMFSNFIGALIELMPTLAARAQPAQAVPVLSDAEIHAADPIPQNRFDQERVEFARAVEQAVRAKFQPPTK